MAVNAINRPPTCIIASLLQPLNCTETYLNFYSRYPENAADAIAISFKKMYSVFIDVTFCDNNDHEITM